jgi:hypothetical protein
VAESSPGAVPDGNRCKANDAGERSLTRLIAPVFAAFSLPTIITFVPGSYPGPAWHDAILALLLAATGLFMGSIQLSIGPLYDRYPDAAEFRAFLTLLGIDCVAVSLVLLVWGAVGKWWVWLPLGVLLLGGVAPNTWILALKIRRRPQAPAGAAAAAAPVAR